jgi:hypothetical protein
VWGLKQQATRCMTCRGQPHPNQRHFATVASVIYYLLSASVAIGHWPIMHTCVYVHGVCIYIYIDTVCYSRVCNCVYTHTHTREIANSKQATKPAAGFASFHRRVSSFDCRRLGGAGAGGSFSSGRAC